MMKVLVCGGRDYADAETLGAWLGGIHRDFGITEIIHGGAKGADFLADHFAKWKSIPVREFAADWGKHGKSAGPIRNQLMLDEGRPDLVVAFPGGRGTKNMRSLAEKAGVRVKTIKGPVQ